MAVLYVCGTLKVVNRCMDTIWMQDSPCVPYHARQRANNWLLEVMMVLCASGMDLYARIRIKVVLASNVSTRHSDCMLIKVMCALWPGRPMLVFWLQEAMMVYSRSGIQTRGKR